MSTMNPMEELCRHLQLKDWEKAERILRNATFSMGEAIGYWHLNYKPSATEIVRAVIELEQKL